MPFYLIFVEEGFDGFGGIILPFGYNAAILHKVQEPFPEHVIKRLPYFPPLMKSIISVDTDRRDHAKLFSLRRLP